LKNGKEPFVIAFEDDDDGTDDAYLFHHVSPRGALLYWELVDRW